MQELAIATHADNPPGAVNTTIARVAHELRTPVSLISGSLENLQESMRMLVEYVEATEKWLGRNDEVTQLREDLRLDYRIEHTPGLLRICSEGAQRLSHVVNQLRFYARAPEIRADARTDVRACLNAAVAMARHGRSHAVEVVWNVDSGVDSVAGPAEFLGQVFLNVVRNALDAIAAAEAPRLEITARAVEEQGHSFIECIIRDNGPGIPAAHRDRIFDDFFSTKHGAEGLGLGLSISRDIVQAVGGAIAVAETGAAGTAFRILLRPA